MIDPSVRPAKSNVECREGYGYDLLNRFISEAGTIYDLNAAKTRS